jgi:hypothetical protein
LSLDWSWRAILASVAVGSEAFEVTNKVRAVIRNGCGANGAIHAFRIAVLQILRSAINAVNNLASLTIKHTCGNIWAVQKGGLKALLRKIVLKADSFTTES